MIAGVTMLIKIYIASLGVSALGIEAEIPCFSRDCSEKPDPFTNG
jgi:hypothetical protein